jgi:pimeloyl-ACP methyl ester carboxylesterase
VLVNGGFLPALPKFIKRMLNLPLLEKRFRAIMRSMTYSDKALARAFPNPEKLPQSFFERIRANEEQQSRIVFDTFRNQVNPQQTPAVPVAIVWGTGDRLASMKQAGLVRAWPSAPDYVSMAGAGHMPQVEAPGEFVKAVTDVARKRGGELEAGSPRSV